METCIVSNRLMFKLMICLLPLLVVFTNSGLFAETYQVGPTRTYTTLQDVTGLLEPGDVVEVDGDHTYPGDVSFTQEGAPDNKITIRGIRINGNRPIISGGTNTVAFITGSPYSGPGADYYIFESFEVTGGTSRGIYHQADDLTIRDVLVRDCPAQGILGADQGSGSITMEYVEVYGCGSGTYQHQIYMATDEINSPGSVFRMQYCYIHDGNGGNNVKTRAERNEIYYNWIENAYYHELELIGADGGDGGNPNLAREDSDVVGNVFRKTSRNFYITRVGGDGTGETNGRYRFVNNTFISGSSAVFRVFDGIESIEMHNNIFYPADGVEVDIMRSSDADWTTGSELIAGSNNWVFENSDNIPSQWTGTLTGANPGFVNFSEGDVRLADTSTLINRGNASPAGVSGYVFPEPLTLPTMHPPLHALPTSGAAETRPTNSQPDIGAFEADAGTDDDSGDGGNSDPDEDDDGDNNDSGDGDDSTNSDSGSSSSSCFVNSL